MTSRSVVRAISLGLAVVAFLGFATLGWWQVERRAWKLNLIEQVTQRSQAAPTAPPTEADWPQVTPARDAYRRVRLEGRYIHDRETLVQASTELGPGFWVITPLHMDDGSNVLVNRGFVPPEARAPAQRGDAALQQPEARVTIDGLVRITEPGGGFLRRNDPAGNRWFSRDVQAIAAARGIDRVAPYFVDADAIAPVSNGAVLTPAWPVGGLTIVAFYNNHLVYALTWFALAAMVAGAIAYVLQDDRRSRRAAAVTNVIDVGQNGPGPTS